MNYNLSNDNKSLNIDNNRLLTKEKIVSKNNKKYVEVIKDNNMEISNIHKKNIEKNNEIFNLNKYLELKDFDINYNQYIFNEKIPTLMFHYIKEVDPNTKDYL
jgi:hypothetical protein